MTANQRTRITIESERVVIVTARQSQGRSEQCGQEVNFSKLEQAGRVLEAVSARLGGTVETSFVLRQLGINSRSV